MFWKRESQIPWDEVGAELGKTLVKDADSMSHVLKKGLQDNLSEPGMPDFEGSRWRYEYCIFQMFWVWSFANLPDMRKAGATETLLDAYHKKAFLSMAEAGLVGTEKFEEMQAWERDCEERFLAYQQVVDNPPKLPTLNFTGTVGWVFARFLFPREEPNPHLTVLLTLAGHKVFLMLDKTIKSLEDTYSQK